MDSASGTGPQAAISGPDGLPGGAATETAGPAMKATRTEKAAETDKDSADHETLKYSLLGPSLLKAGQETVDQTKVSDIIYNASRGSKFFAREEERDRLLSAKIEQTLAKKAALERLDLSHERRRVDGLLAQLEAERDLSQHIVHVDCDAFYAAVELLDRPDLADVPFAVGGGVLSTCNYVARTFGCRSGMAGFVARKLCPQLVLLKPDFAKYNAKAQEIRAILACSDPHFESASIDEAFLYITDYCTAHGMAPADAVAQLRREIADQTRVTVSAGIAANTRLAKICSNMNKPNGQFVLANDRTAILRFMADLPCRKVNGIGRVFERELAAVGIKTCGDIFEQRQFLARLFGDKACHFLAHCYLGLGRTRVQPADTYERKSVGTESTFESITDPAELRQKLRWTAGELEKDLYRAECKGRTLVLKVKLHTFDVHTRQVVTAHAVHRADDLYNHALPMLRKLEEDIPGMRVRLLGLRCTNLVSTKKPDAYAFFGLRPPARDSGGGPQDVGGGQGGEDYTNEGLSVGIPGDGEAADWETDAQNWVYFGPEKSGQLLDQAPNAFSGTPSPQRHQGGFPEPSEPPEPPERPRRHGKEIAPNPTSATKGPMPQREQWDCPVCNRPQSADERQFNNHIDACLSRRTILEALHESALEGPAAGAGEANRSPQKRLHSETNRRTGKKRAGAAIAAGDAKQKKLIFGTR